MNFDVDKYINSVLSDAARLPQKEVRVFIALSNVAAFLGETEIEQFRALRKYFGVHKAYFIMRGLNNNALWRLS